MCSIIVADVMAIGCAVRRDYSIYWLTLRSLQTQRQQLLSLPQWWLPGKKKYSLPVIIPIAILPNSSGLYGSAASDDSHCRIVQAQLHGQTDSWVCTHTHMHTSEALTNKAHSCTRRTTHTHKHLYTRQKHIGTSKWQILVHRYIKTKHIPTSPTVLMRTLHYNPNLKG